MSASLECVAETLFDKLCDLGEFTTIGRRLKHWSDLTAEQQPALFQVQSGLTIEQRTGLPSKRTVHFQIWLYANTGGDPDGVPASVLNPIVDAIIGAFAPTNPASNVNDLGGIVFKAAISGKVETDEGVLGSQAVVVIPIDVILP